MPIYEYRCHGCNEVFEVYQGHRDPPPASHRCGATEVTRVLSRTSFRLVGDGWYQSDYGSRPQPPAAEAKGDKPKAENQANEGKTPADAGASKGAAKADGAAAPAAAPSAPASAKGTDRTG